MKINNTLFALALLAVAGCAATKETMTAGKIDFYKIGHRGTRGYEPENTIPSMKRAWDLGANTIEYDVWLSKDNKIVVNHDATLNNNYNSLPGKPNVDKADQAAYVIRQNNYATMRQVIVGGKPYSNFPKQEMRKSYMPLMTELIDSLEDYTGKKVMYLLEIKTDPKADGVKQPAPEDYMKTLMAGFDYKELGSRLIIQSFDERVLQVLHRTHAGIALGYLVGKGDFESNMAKLGFKPAFYNPEQKLVSKELVDNCHKQGIKITPWTVNTAQDVAKIKADGVDGIITDYPDLLK